MRAELQKCPEGQDKKTYADLIVKRMLKEAIEKGDYAQIKLIWNYIEGMPSQKVDVTSGGKRIGLFDYTDGKQDRDNNSDQEDTGDDQADKDRSGRDISE